MAWRQWHWQKGSPAEDQKSVYQRDGSGPARETMLRWFGNDSKKT